MDAVSWLVTKSTETPTRKRGRLAGNDAVDVPYALFDNIIILFLFFDVRRKKRPFPTELSDKEGLLGEVGADKTVLYRDIVALQKGMMVSYTLLPIWLAIHISMVSDQDAL